MPQPGLPDANAQSIAYFSDDLRTQYIVSPSRPLPMSQLIGGVTPSLGAGAVDAGTQRVTLGSQSPTFIADASAPVVLGMFAKGNTPASNVTLDLTTKSGAWVYGVIGRNATTALTNAAYIAIRPTKNGSTTQAWPSSPYDMVSSTVAAGASTTLNGDVAAGATTAIVTSATGLAVGDIICMNNAGARIEFARIIKIASTTITFEQPLKIAHTSGDQFTNGSDVFGRVWLPGGDIYRIFVVNPDANTPNIIAGLEAATAP